MAKEYCFKDYWNPIRDEILKDEESLDRLNYNLLLVLLKILEINHVKIHIASDLPVDTLDPTQRLVDLCKETNATSYISGRGGKDYMELDKFEAVGIKVIYQDLDFNNIVYSQGEDPFVPGLSVIDAIFNIGPEETRKLIKSAWSP